MNFKKVLISGSILGITLLGIVSTNVNACGLKVERAYSASWAKTTTSVNTNSTYNNTLYAETIAWSVSNSGVESFHQGPRTTRYNQQYANSQVSVPTGRGTWFECHWEGHCNRCGSNLGRAKQMFAF